MIHRRIVTGVAACLFSLLIGGCANVEPPTEAAAEERPSVDGLWEVVSVKNVAKDVIQPHRREFHMFQDGHQMVILAGEERPKLEKSLSDMNAEEFMSQQPIGAGYYKYVVDGNKITRTNVVALSAYYEDRSFEGEVEIGPDTLVLRDSHSADGDLREWSMRRVK